MYRVKMHTYMATVRKSEANVPRGRPKRRWEDNIKMVLQ